MTPKEAAEHYHKLSESEPHKAPSFARSYEDKASESEYDEYLKHIENPAKGWAFR